MLCLLVALARIFHELLSRDRENGRAIGKGSVVVTVYTPSMLPAYRSRWVGESVSAPFYPSAKWIVFSNVWLCLHILPNVALYLFS